MQAIGPTMWWSTCRYGPSRPPASVWSSIWIGQLVEKRNLVHTAPNRDGGIDPSVVARSVFKDPLALDAAFNGFNSRRKRPW